MHTERLYFYNVDPNGRWTIDTKTNVRPPFHVVKEGIAFETAKTPQAHLKNLGRKNFTRSGMWEMKDGRGRRKGKRKERLIKREGWEERKK